MFTLSDIQWAAEECERQQSGELSVSHLCDALYCARNFRDSDSIINFTVIKALGRHVEPNKNNNGFRQVPVFFSNLTTALDWWKIESALTSLINNGQALTPIEWYKEFELIHPFIDGNGRVGSILFNFKNGTLNEPILPPKMFN